MTSITWAGPRCMQEAAAILGPQNRTQGRCVVFKGYNIAWAQYRGKFTNMNIFSSMISLEDMMMRTSGVADDCTGPGDYLSWADMEWSVSGDVTSGVMIQEELCQRY